VIITYLVTSLKVQSHKQTDPETSTELNNKGLKLT